MSAAASRSCSQLSNTSRRWRPSKAAATRSATLLTRLLCDAEDGSHSIRHRGRIGDGGKFDDPHPVGEAVGQPCRNLQCESGLADAAYTDQRYQPMGFQCRFQVGDFSLSSHEAGGGARRFPGVVSVFNGGNSVRRPGART